MVSQSAESRSVVASGTRVNLVFKEAFAEVPDVTGFPEATALAQLERGGFTVLVRPKEGAAGIVVDQTPRGGSPAGAERQVTLFVGSG